jgi:hypothetical protein
MAKKSPFEQVNEQHGGKEKLVDKLLGMIERGEAAKDEFRTRLLRASNTQLLRLFKVSSEVKAQFGDKDKLVDALLGLMKKVKDKDYRDKLLSYTPARLLDMYRSWQKKSKAA